MQESEMSAILALVNAFRPKNEPETMLAAQMVATHLLTMKVGARALRYDYATRTAASYAKLAKAFAMQTDALQVLKGRKRTARHTITVTRDRDRKSAQQGQSVSVWGDQGGGGRIK